MKRRTLAQAMEAWFNSPPDVPLGASFPEPIEMPYEVVCRWPAAVGMTDTNLLHDLNNFTERAFRDHAMPNSITMSFGALVAVIRQSEPVLSEEEARKAALDFLREHEVID